ncbi:GNAT family N-acetyltransferase [Brachybacterium sp. MASK1Z-5]|uniref:GNAT family N-acetyltransferase n=1 Tax=Brachybacterium halotolerans TaxID=2795215 RepID=A0ABS1B5F4_9MICO|nr:GNAT family N-acetyltransferase [Brachybacterium halotolerans]MBK0329882.1 GNAT family N-acetyltransferase [Brachybacterium halotolerans]
MGARRDAGSGAGAGGTAASAAYPAHWEADIALSDGSAAHLRPILPSDADALQRFHTAQSEHSRYLRFFAPMPELSPRDLTRFTVVDHRDRVALIVLIGEDIVAVGRFDRLEGTAEAEVAFNVADSQQGKGLGSVLLEHLAAAARERGVATFVADVLPQNSRMINVFTDAGFDVRRTYDDGVVVVEFSIDPTERSRAVIAEREHRAEARAMERMLHPASIAVLGVSSHRDSMGGRILRHIEQAGYDGELHVVARDALELQGHSTHSRIADVPGPVDLAVIALARAEDCIAAVEECGRAGVRAVLLPTEAFAETAGAGAADGHGAAGGRGAHAPGAAERPSLQRSLVSAARREGVRVLGPGSLGFLRTGEHALNASLVPHLPRAGGVALAGQSGALSAMLLGGVESRGIGVHEFVSVGNRADVSLNDTLQHWQDDEDVRVIALSLESMGNPRKFTRIARRITRERPLVVLRPPGTTTAAPPGHDVRSSQLPRRALDQVLLSAGVVPTLSVDQLTDVVDALDRQGVPPGDRVGLLANTAALGESLRGAADAAGLRVVRDERRALLGTDPRFVERAFTSLAALGEVDVVVLAVLDALGEDLSASLARMARTARGADVRLVVCVVTDLDRFESLERATRGSDEMPPLHPTPVLAVRAAAGMLAARRGAVGGDEPASREGIDREAARRIVQTEISASGAPGAAPRALDQERTGALLETYGLHLLPSRTVSDADDAVRAASEIGYPVALKSTDPVLSHRSDLGGVRLDIPDAVQLRHAFAAMRRDLAFSSADLAVQAMAAPGIPVVVRSVEDPSLGPVLAFSLAGDATDLLDDVAYAIPPLDDESVRRLIDGPATSVKLRGHLGLPAADRARLEDLVIRVGLMAEDLPELHSLVLHPVVVGRGGCTIIGARAEVAQAPNRTDSLRRTLSGPASA